MRFGSPSVNFFSVTFSPDTDARTAGKNQGKSQLLNKSNKSSHKQTKGVVHS